MNMLVRNRRRDVGNELLNQQWEDLVRSVFNYFPGFRSELVFGNAIDTKLDYEVMDNEVKLKLPCPGCQAKDFDVEVVGDFVTIRVSRREMAQEHGHPDSDCECKCRYICRERSFEEYEESVKLPVMVKGSEAKAKYEDGILTVTIPRLGEAKALPHQVKVN